MTDGELLPSHVPQEVISGCRRKDESAQRELYELTRQRLYRLVLRMVGSTDAPDVFQDVYLTAFENFERFAGKSRIETWLYRLAINECLQCLRKRRRRSTRALTSDLMNRDAGHEQDAEYRELLEQALARLDPDLKSIFLLREVEKLTYAEIAESLSLNEGTVASRLNRARRELKLILVQLGWEP